MCRSRVHVEPRNERHPFQCFSCGAHTTNTYSFLDTSDFGWYDAVYMCSRCTSLDMLVDHEQAKLEMEDRCWRYVIDNTGSPPTTEEMQRAFEFDMIPSGLLEDLADC